MKNYIIYNSTGNILRSGSCTGEYFLSQKQISEFIMEGTANDVTQKVEFDGLDQEDQPINPGVVDKTEAEILRDNLPRPVVPHGRRQANITNDELQDMLNRVKDLEER